MAGALQSAQHNASSTHTPCTSRDCFAAQLISVILPTAASCLPALVTSLLREGVIFLVIRRVQYPSVHQVLIMVIRWAHFPSVHHSHPDRDT